MISVKECCCRASGTPPGPDQHRIRAKRESLRLGPIRLQLLADGTWIHWDRQRLARTGGTLEQYKHPCLIADLKFREA